MSRRGLYFSIALIIKGNNDLKNGNQIGKFERMAGIKFLVNYPIFIICFIVLLYLSSCINLELVTLILLVIVYFYLFLEPIFYSSSKEIETGFSVIPYVVIFLLSGLFLFLSIFMTGSAWGGGSMLFAKDARIKVGIDQMRSVAEIYKSVNGKYSNSIINYSSKTECPEIEDSFLALGSDGDKACKDIQMQNPKGELQIRVNNLTDKDAKWCFAKRLLTQKEYFCADYTGYFGNSSGCSESDYKCNY